MNELQQLIADFLDGNSRTFNAMRQRILQYLYRHSASKFLDAEDICSEVMQILINNLRSGKFSGNSLGELNAYIYRIVSNHVCDLVKKFHRRSECENELALEKKEQPDIESKLTAKSIIDSVFADLDENCRTLLKLKFMEGHSDQEIADKLQKSKNAISTAISRCVKKAFETEIIQAMLKE